MAKTIYIKDEDIPTWDRAKELAGDKLAPTIVEGLKRFVVEKEASAKGFERIVVRYDDALDGKLPKIRAFWGRWLISTREPLELFDEDTDRHIQCSVAETAKGNWVVLYESRLDSARPLLEQKLLIFRSASEAAAHPDATVAIRKAIENRGIQVEELDI